MAPASGPGAATGWLPGVDVGALAHRSPVRSVARGSPARPDGVGATPRGGGRGSDHLRRARDPPRPSARPQPADRSHLVGPRRSLFPARRTPFRGSGGGPRRPAAPRRRTPVARALRPSRCTDRPGARRPLQGRTPLVYAARVRSLPSAPGGQGRRGAGLVGPGRGALAPRARAADLPSGAPLDAPGAPREPGTVGVVGHHPSRIRRSGVLRGRLRILPRVSGHRGAIGPVPRLPSTAPTSRAGSWRSRT